MEQLVQEGKLKQLLHHSNGWAEQTSSDPRRDAFSRPPLGTINVIFVAPRRTRSYSSRVMSVTRLPAKNFSSKPKRAIIDIQSVLSFSDKDKIGTI